MNNLNNGNMVTIQRKGRPLFCKEMRVGDLDSDKCSYKFLSHHFDADMVVRVKCLLDGELDLRGKKEEYRIIVPDNKENGKENQ